jgi:cytochrome c553
LLYKQTFLLFAVLPITILSAYSKAVSSSTFVTNDLSAKVDVAIPAPSPQLHVAMKADHVMVAELKADKPSVNIPDEPKNPVPDGNTAAKINPIMPSPDAQVRGWEKSELCRACHGEKGNSIEPLIPKLAGQYSKYISKQIHDFKTDERTHQIMSVVAMTVSENDVDDIAAYFASQPKMNSSGQGNPVGESIFLNGNSTTTLAPCIYCHGKNGKGLTPNSSTFPVIGGQHKEYIRKQLKDFRGKIRNNSPGRIMNTITKSLTDDEIEALADYISKQ